jgi:hypothetical protein
MENLQAALERRMKRLNGIPDARSAVGIAARGPAQYGTGSQTGNIGPVGMGMMTDHQRRKQLGSR